MKQGILTGWILALCGTASARYIEGINWADRVVYHTDKIQSFVDGYCGGPGALMMQSVTPATTWLVLGPGDADGNGDLYAWDFDRGDRDYVAGWRSASAAHADQEIIVQFDHGIRDAAGDDLVIRLYGGPLAAASVWASTDGRSFTQIGVIEGQLNGLPGTPGRFYDASFDLDGRFAEPVHFIRVCREVTQPQSGMFFDSFRTAYVDLPEIGEPVARYGWSLKADVNQDGYVNLNDLAGISAQWKRCNDPNHPLADLWLFEDPNSIPSSCHGVHQAGMGMDGDLNRDCRVDLADLQVFTEFYLLCNDPDDPACLPNWPEI